MAQRTQSLTNKPRLGDYSSNSPLATVTNEEIKLTGQVNVENILNVLPQVAPDVTSNSNNPGGGIATVDLRALEPNRTLVLINGKRVVPSDDDGTVDLNNIPAALVDRVEVITGGASAVYGSDAIAGVVNFILKRDFEGVAVGTSYGVSDEGDGREWEMNAAIGSNVADGKGNVTFFVNYADREGILASERDYTAIDNATGSSRNLAGRIVNSATNPFLSDSEGAANVPDNDGEVWINGCSPLSGTSTALVFNNDNTVEGFCNLLPETNGGIGDRYNFVPTNFIKIPQERVNIAGTSYMELGDSGIEAYLEGFFTDSRTGNQLAPSPLVSSAGVTIDPDLLNPLLLTPELLAALATRPVDDAPAVIERRFAEFGPRGDDFDSNTYQITAGLRGDLWGNWTWDGYFQYSRAEFVETITNDLSKLRLQNALDNCPVGSDPECAALTLSDGPLDLFGIGGITEGWADYLRISQIVNTLVFERQMIGVSTTGSLFDMGAGDVEAALGFEYRDDSSDFIPDDYYVRGDIVGFNQQLPIAGSVDVFEYFAELYMPLISGMDWVDILALEAGYRYSDYSSVGGVDTYKIGLEWGVNEWVRFRGMYQKATRAPSVFELFQAGDEGSPTVTDPCDAPATPTIALQCQSGTAEQIALGVPGVGLDPAEVAAFVQPNTQIRSILTGNANLDPETADTWTLGAVVTTGTGLTATIDWYQIEIEDYIGRLFGGEQALIDACYTGLDPVACSQLDRLPSGDLDITAIALSNLSQLQTSGIDLAIAYTTDLEELIGMGGELTLGTAWTWTNEWVLDGTDYAGTYTFDWFTFPDWKGNIRATYENGPVTFSWRWRYTSNVNQNFTTSLARTFGGSEYHDVTALYRPADGVELSLQVENLFDTEPEQYTGNNIQSNTDPLIHDVVGRFFRVGVNAEF